MGKGKRYFKPNDLCFSEVYGDGIYTFTGDFITDPFGTAGDEATSPILINTLTGDTFFARRVGGSERSLAQCRDRILHPADRRHIVWPADMIKLKDEQAESFGLFVAHNYRVAPADQGFDRYALLFPCGGWPSVINATDCIADFDQLTWRDPKVRKVAISIVAGIEAINRSGYVYCDIHPSRIFFKDDDSVFLDYSNLVYSLSDTISPEANFLCAPLEGEYPIEFAEPAYVNRKDQSKRALDLQSQNYSISALLFYLFFGRYPYDGRLLDGVADNDLHSHYAKFKKYHSLPIFIFDPEDTQNALGIFTHEQQLIQLWQELPQTLRDFFLQALQKNSAMRMADVPAPSAGMWLQHLAEIDWPA